MLLEYSSPRSQSANNANELFNSILGRKSVVRTGRLTITGGEGILKRHSRKGSMAAHVENKEVLVNPDCYIGVIMEYIMEVASLTKNINFRLCSVEGEIIEIKDAPLNTSGLIFFVPGETYVIVVKERTEDGREGVYTPLLNKRTELYAQVCKKLHIPSSDEEVSFTVPITLGRKSTVRDRRMSLKPKSSPGPSKKKTTEK